MELPWKGHLSSAKPITVWLRPITSLDPDGLGKEKYAQIINYKNCICN